MKSPNDPQKKEYLIALIMSFVLIGAALVFALGFVAMIDALGAI